ncbi:twin-arginine translocation signal domain-containing protein [Chitinophaga lutea]|uniref:Twin-arginine translocation signal domain-containing protein n=1 Tax=Chitinophaga lutea TaxID=2488634 RepID=A0A3N4PZL1_9BACT|nr:N(4)-(beta-N-acetylglucosaminyl)-L-asparaginase [Chitinophaga lutea]RPE12349.1 twin-arginine translocation signal domain-containing protein [Chitinophaga lutea]
MNSRRNFLKTAALGAAALSIDGIPAAAQSKTKGKVRKPIVVSTWDFGVAANKAAWEVLKKGGRALDAVENGVHVPESDPSNQTVGYGGFPDRDGRVTLDACIMDELGNCGSVAALEHIVHPISVARKVMEKTPHVMLVGDGALQFALENGFKKENLLTPESEKAWKEWLKKAEYKPVINIENKSYQGDGKGTTAFNPLRLPGNQYNHDTIGMIALDAAGNLSGACTTSGMAFKLHGRVGDSPIIGAGLYVDNEVGAATATGVGEEVIRVVGSFLVVELMRQGYSPEAACKEAVMRIVKKKPAKAKEIQIGFLALNKKGEHGAFCLQKGFSYAVATADNQEQLIQGKHYF